MSLAAGRAPLGPLAEKQHQLRQAAEQFEAILLAHWWEQMRHSGFGPGTNADPTYSAINASGMEAVSMAMARAGGIGIARMLVAALEPDLGREAAPKANGQRRAGQGDTQAAVKALKSVAAEPITPVKGESLAEWR